MTVTIDAGLTWREVARVAAGEELALSPAAFARVEQASRIVARIVETGARAYGINTGVGALADTVVDRASQNLLSRSIVLSHACGVGPLLAAREVRAIIAAEIANFAHGHSACAARSSSISQPCWNMIAFPMCRPRALPVISSTMPILPLF